MNDLIITIRSWGIGAIPFIFGFLIYNGTDSLSKVMSVLLFLFGIILVSFLINDYLKTRKVRRRHLGYGDLK